MRYEKKLFFSVGMLALLVFFPLRHKIGFGGGGAYVEQKTAGFFGEGAKGQANRNAATHDPQTGMLLFYFDDHNREEEKAPFADSGAGKDEPRFIQREQYFNDRGTGIYGYPAQTDIRLNDMFGGRGQEDSSGR